MDSVPVKGRSRHPHKEASSPKKKDCENEEADAFIVDLDNTFPVHISVERAMHLSLVVEDR